MRVVSLEEELRSSEEMVRTLQNTSQLLGGSVPSGKVEGIGEEDKMEVMARVVSEAAIAKGKTTGSPSYNIITASVAMVIATVLMVTYELELMYIFLSYLNCVLCGCHLKLLEPSFQGK